MRAPVISSTVPPPTLSCSPAWLAGAIVTLTSALVPASERCASLVDCRLLWDVTATVSGASPPVQSSRLPPVTLMSPTPWMWTVPLVAGARASSCATARLPAARCSARTGCRAGRGGGGVRSRSRRRSVSRSCIAGGPYSPVCREAAAAREPGAAPSRRSGRAPGAPARRPLEDAGGGHAPHVVVHGHVRGLARHPAA